MNERIKELAEQSGLNYHNWITNESNINDGDFKYPRLEDYEKFVKLIVRECIEKITTYDLTPGHSAKWEDIYDIHARLLQDLGEELKEHFGVK
jgi:hypothetical protein